jgi:protein-S-isoprenylcysteine O-methyltransferase Ste14
MTPAKWIDLPPLWLLAALVAGWLQVRFLPLGPEPGTALHWAAGAVVGLGILLGLAAAITMARARTTVIPHREADALVTGGVFALSRNPIYLGDLMVLAGALVWWGAWPSLVLVPLFGRILLHRFVLPEEARLRARFGAAFDAYAWRTRRWI